VEQAMNWLFGFSGRMSRLDWWLAQLVIVVALAMMVGILASLGLGAEAMDIGSQDGGSAGIGLSMVMAIIATAGLVIWINLASTVKRFHDRNKSGFWALIIFLPYVGAIWQIVECGCLSGTPGGNDYGSGGSGGGSRDLDEFADQLAAEYGRGTKAAPEAPRMALARIQAGTPMPTNRRVAQSGFGRRGV